MRTWRIGLYGLGTVGRGLVEILREMEQLLPSRAGARFEIVSIVDRSPERKGNWTLGKRISDDPDLILKDPDIDIAVELIGGVDAARSFVTEALKSGKHVVTANKALLAAHAAEIFPLAKNYGRHIMFEAAVAGALPVIKSLRRGLVANEIQGLYGILNGTCNFIITRMQQDRMSYADALRLAQQKGFAEADPAFDVGGHDAAQKLALLSSLAFDGLVQLDWIRTRGIVGLDRIDLQMAEHYGYSIRLLAVARRLKEGLLFRVHPALLHADHTLASVCNEQNAVFFDASNSGPLLITGSGAGSRPTAAAVVSDLVAIGNADRPECWPAAPLAAPRANQAEYEFYLRFQAVDRPGVLAHISRILADCGVSISSMHQPSGHEPVNVVLLTHRAPEDSIRLAAEQIAVHEFILADPVILPIETRL
ncbi:MAG: homoserine dehydrogenase [Spirochaetales bacterium]|nr:homoserine dehydrogenase [Spirochaetales bacterium]